MTPIVGDLASLTDVTSPAPEAAEVDYPLLPTDDEVIPADEDVASAVAAALQEPAPVAGEPPEAYGSTWQLDFLTNRFRRHGDAPIRISGIAGLGVWCEMAIRTARFAHSVFSDDFGMDRPEDIIGHVDIGELVGDYEARIREALLVHDRIVDVTGFDADYSADTGVLTIRTFEIVTDDQRRVPVGPLRLESGA